jgi:flavin-dependent dehydrogenase
MNTKLFDCAIIGGGLAGLSLAIQLADAGHSVILFERHKYPFHKVCGEYISMESYDFLERIGVALSTMKLPIINEIKISSPNGNSFTRKLDLGGFGITRYTLDSHLAELALRKGVVLLEETKAFDITFENELFAIKTSQGTFKSKTACGAYGKQSSLDQKLDRKSGRTTKNYIAVKYHVQIDLPENRIELHNFKDGYCGVSKVEGDKYCLCYLTNSQNLKDNANDIKAMEKNVLMKNSFLMQYFTEAVFLYKQPLTISQITFSKKTAVKNHVLILGDAAGNISPLCGNGMSMAMNASCIAFDLINEYLEDKISIQDLEYLYERQWNCLFSNRIKTGKYIQHLFGKETLTNISVGILKKTPLLLDKLISITHGSEF